jgi:hypothetical protein
MTRKKITLYLDEESYPLVLRQFGPEGAKAQAISMALKQYPNQEIGETELYSCLSILESDLQGMFPRSSGGL